MGKTIIDIDLIKHYLNNYTVNSITYNGNDINIFTVDGVVLWSSFEYVALDVSKITSDTYAGETTYTNESFILLDIYPKATGSSVRVTYGDLTKELTFTGTNAQQVFFGTFNGVSDEVDTPSSGRLTIEGEYKGFGVGGYRKSSSDKTSTANHCSCITSIVSLSGIEMLPTYAFNKCSSITNASIPNSVTTIPQYAFNECVSLAMASLPSDITSIGNYAFYDCRNTHITEIPEGVTSIGKNAFYWNLDDVNDKASYDLLILPSSLLEIGESAFCKYASNRNQSYGEAEYYSMYKNIIVRATTPPTIDNDRGVFGRGKGLDSITQITVPKGCGDAYKTAWSVYADKIVEEQ